MSRLAQMRLGRSLVLGCLLGTLSGASARGACGDWLDHPAPNHDAQPERAPAASIPTEHLPCSGPACQQAPINPAPAPPVELSLREKPGLNVSAIAARDESRSREDEHPQDEDRISDGYYPAVRRPPRTGGLG